MYTIQRRRFFPLPHYDLSEKSRVIVSISGKVIDENYTKLLATRFDLDLKTIVLIDKVQRKDKITKDECEFLRKNKLIEGRYPDIFIASNIAETTDTKEKYIKNKAFDKEYYKDLIIKYLMKYKSASRKNIDELLMDKLPDFLSEEKKKTKIKNILHDMSNDTIKNKGSNKFPEWILKK
jgi:ATP-dependent DNA helicase RecG